MRFVPDPSKTSKKAPSTLTAGGKPPEGRHGRRRQFVDGLSGAAGIERLGCLSAGEKRTLRPVLQRFPWAATPYYLSLAQADDIRDPILRQVLPSLAELEVSRSANPDPLEEEAHTLAPGLIRRFPDRAVLLVTNRCAVFCRYCFRKRLWREKAWTLSAAALQAACAALEADHAIREVILSGGDPLTLADSCLDTILGRLRRIPHLELIRIGTRLPVVLPQRLTPALCRVLERHAPVWVVTQFNHPGEITPEAAAACDRLLRAGVPVDNQTVLLRGINDDPGTLSALCLGLLRIRVRPYYLHQCDRVTGAEHFRTPLAKGMGIMREMQERISGLALPRFVVDLPGSGGKVPLQPDHILSQTGRRILLKGNDGRRYDYEDPA